MARVHHRRRRLLPKTAGDECGGEREPAREQTGERRGGAVARHGKSGPEDGLDLRCELEVEIEQRGRTPGEEAEHREQGGRVPFAQGGGEGEGAGEEEREFLGRHGSSPPRSLVGWGLGRGEGGGGGPPPRGLSCWWR